MNKIKALQSSMAENGIEDFGVCAFDSALVLSTASQRRLPKNPQSIISAVFPYYSGLEEHGNISLYAMVSDYHQIVKPRLLLASDALSRAFPQNSFVAFTDASPMDEIHAAQRAGLGMVGKNGLLITKKYSSFCFIGEIVTDLSLPATDFRDVCENCGACIKACPTGALTPHGFKKELCRSLITQKKGELTALEAEEIQKGGLIWGCDLCQLACPHSKNPSMTPIKEFKKLTTVISLDNLDEFYPKSSFNWRKKEVIIRNIKLAEKSGC
ncbi:MAG: DUF1730 domain-containing protein [Oscillospiraceae bacterium]